MEKCWRWGSAGGFRSVMGLMGVELLVIFQLVHSQPTCPAAPAQENLTQPQYEAATQKDPSVGFMAPFSQSFLNTVQPNPFPAGQCHHQNPLEPSPCFSFSWFMGFSAQLLLRLQIKPRKISLNDCFYCCRVKTRATYFFHMTQTLLTSHNRENRIGKPAS